MLTFLFTIFFLMPLNNIPKYDLAVSSAGMYFDYNAENDVDHIEADKKYMNKYLLVGGYFGRETQLFGYSIILELSSNSNHIGSQYVIAVMNNKKRIIMKDNERVVVRCVGGGYAEIGSGVQPVLKECILVKGK